MPYYVYITTNPGRSTLFIGMSDNLCEQLNEHYKNRGDRQTFPGRYYCYKLIYYETYKTAQKAIEREKELKKWSHKKKKTLIENENPQWEFINYL
ncbi:endonuclease [Aliifodinibius salipaludis]|uniref:Endonuclease n=1 Tax=Fodinibius salipaludis TaxID=2032627 RepID=A0A2A2GCH3_9BACT|nr:endonuclease [Aliifodinibius salipaludis]